MNPNDLMAKLPSPLASATSGEPRQWYRIEGAGNAATTDAAGGDTSVDEVDVYVYGVIGGWWAGVDAKTFIRAIQGVDAKQLNVHINSVGGSAFDGLAIFQALRNHPARIVTYVDALAASAASVIAMAGDRRVVAPYASVMVHRAWTLAIGDDIELRKCSDELGRLSKNLARVYANRSTSEATVDEWLDVMTEETWYYGEEAVEAGLMHEVQADTEKTGDSGDANPSVVPDTEDATDGEGDEVARLNRYAMAFFNFAGRDASTSPRMPGATQPPAAATAPRADIHTSGAEPEPTTEPEEDDVSTDLSEFRSRLGLTDDADETAVLAALDELKAKADNPPTPQPDPDVEAKAVAQAAANADLTAKVELLTEQVQSMGAQLAAANVEKAAAAKTAVIDSAAKAGKFTPADRPAWEARYDKSPEVTTEVLAAIPANTAVPTTAAGTTGAADEVNAEGELTQAERDLFPTTARG